MLGTQKSISALMTKMKNPSVTKINGALRINNTGRTNAFRMPSNNAAPMSAPVVSYRIPLTNAGATITATVVMIQRKTKCRMATRYSKFQSSRKRFAKSACNTGLISRFGSQSKTADVARKSKIETEKQTNDQGSETTARGVGGSAAAEPKAIDAASKSKGTKAARKKKTVRAIKRIALKKASSSASIYQPSDEEIRIRAYFIAERRIQLSLQGDSDHDWIEARRQLVEEATRTAS